MFLLGMWWILCFLFELWVVELYVLVYGKWEYFVIQMVYVSVLCASCGSPLSCVLYDLQFANAGRECKCQPYENMEEAPNDTAYKRWICPSNGVPIYSFWASGPYGPAGWLIRASDVGTNPGPIITHKQVWICDICHKLIQGRKQVSVRCNRIENWVHQRCADIRQA